MDNPLIKKFPTNKVVLLKTHTWNNEIESFATKIKAETKSIQVDFFILIHDEMNINYGSIKNEDIKQNVLVFKEADIRTIYTTGFYSMWLSNHWILMWFFKQHKNKYEYFWTVEYDVRIVGDGNLLWKNDHDYDFIYPFTYAHNPGFCWINHYVGDQLPLKKRYHGYLQLTRYSKKFLTYLDLCYLSGENGQDEMITFSLAVRGNFSMSNKLLKPLIRGKWTWQNCYSIINRKVYDKLISMQSNKTCILHPIK